MIAYLWMPGDNTELSERVLERDREWVVPYLWRSEFRNVLANYIRRGLLSLEEGLRAAMQAERHMRGRERLAVIL